MQWIEVFSRKDYSTIFLESIKFCQSQKGLVVYAWVILTNPIYLIIGIFGETINNITRDLKKITSLKIKKAIKKPKTESRREWMLWIACPT